MVSAMTVNMANAAVSLKSSGDQWGPAVQDLMNAKENGNWNEARFISTFNNRFNGTAEEAKALLDSLKSGNIPQSAEAFNNSISTPNPGNGNGNGNGNNGGSTCTGNPHDCNSGVTKDELDASQKAQDDKQAAVDKVQDDKLADHDSRIKDLEDNKPADGKDGADGQKGDKGDKGDTGAAGADGKNGVDGKDGLNGKDADTSNLVDKETQATRDTGQDVRMDGIEKQAGILDTRVGKTEVRLDNAEGAIRETNDQLAVTDKRSQNNSVRLDGVETKNTEQDKLISQKVDTTTFKDDQARQDAVIATKASKKELASETASRKSADAALSSRIDSNDATLVQHDQRITSNTQRIGSVEGRVSNLEQSTNKRFADVDKRIGENRKVASAGIAGAGAMANIPQVTQNGNFSVGAGIGGYDGEQAVAVGFSARVTNSVTTKVSVSTNTQSEVLWGAGVGVEW